MHSILIRSFILFYFLISFFTVCSQVEKPELSTELKLKEEKAEQYLVLGDTYSASEEYYTAFEEAEKPAVKAYFLELSAEMSEINKDYRKAADRYGMLEAEYSAFAPQAILSYARMIKQQGNYELAAEKFKWIIRNYSGPDRFGVQNLAERELKGCKIAIQENENTSEYSVSWLDSGVNAAYTEFGPLLYESKLYYSSVRLDSLMRLQGGAKRKVYSRFYSAHQDSLNWIFDGPEWEELNEKRTHIGNAAISDDGYYLAFTQCQFRNGRNRCELFLSENKGGRWGKPDKMPEEINLDEFTQTHPSFAREERRNQLVLYFSSDRDGGKGGMDIWYTSYDERREEWGRPRNAGRDINTEGDEITPFYSMEEGSLYFSSNNKIGFGGYDVFKIRGAESRWQGDAENLGNGINGPADELYFRFYGELGKGFLVSNRVGSIALKHETCCDDIYYVTGPIQKDLFLEQKVLAYSGKSSKKARKAQTHDKSEKTLSDASVKVYYLKGTSANAGKRISDDSKSNPEADSIEQYIQKSTKNRYLSENEKPVDSLDLNPRFNPYLGQDLAFDSTAQLIWGDSTDQDGKALLRIPPKDGEYVFIYEKDGFFRERLSMDGKDFLNFLRSGKGDTMGLPPVRMRKMDDQPIVIQDILYEFNSPKLSDESKSILDTTLYKTMIENPEIKVEVGSHTDSKGDEEYNMKLSQNRAEAVVEYLTTKGIEKDRLVSKGYGESKPVAPNTNPDGTDNPEGRAKNRRTEFKIINR